MWVTKFQFHIGSIQAPTLLPYRLPVGDVSIPHWFDSSRARLCALRVRQWFQFHIGSIQARLMNVFMNVHLMFQFHIGSIQAPNSIQCGNLGEAVSIPHWFDSSKKSARRTMGPITRFNSTLVRFKHCARDYPHAWEQGFNSTLVRFKRRAVIGSGQIIHWFQFHIGSIQARKFSIAATCQSKVSIPHWFDSSSTLFCATASVIGVSIPHWFDSSSKINSRYEG